MKLAVLQMDSVWQDSRANMQQLAEQLAKLSDEDIDVLVLPELFHSGFSMDIENVAETKQGAVYPGLMNLARQHQCYLIAGFAERIDGMTREAPVLARNCALVFDRNGNEQACYLKNHPFSLSGEQHFYQAGSQTVLFEIDGVPCSVFICYDLRFPELFRKVMPQTEMVFVIANWPSSRQRHWEILLQARAIENQCFVVGVNRTGTDANGLHYAGGSMVVDPLGDVLAHWPEVEQYGLFTVDTEKVKQVRQQFPFLQDRK
ncbi:carbon-nitrogen family hydrolase [Thiomicrorhabdus sp. zzn3]|uniref:carbon-nitrogen family hydrolase n=1 Tax=Thiomicrorhabdus sp. zzn3 TaxID=3039775 RepID=UPI002436D029|nr:carbon-nitrogen family hydrolase [Thiomicrorhabdus sp. zzn3]MDG6777541.1 carbon-nitrogen family hydrolase [Thiomicrorhabdus sp. zzn3]